MITGKIKILLMVCILLITMSSLCFSQAFGGAQDKNDYRTIAIGFDPLQFILGVTILDMIIIAGNVEYAVTKNISLLANLAYVQYSGLSGFQVGGGGRFYFNGQGLDGMWLGANCDVIYIPYGQLIDFEATVLIGYKIVLGSFFIDPFAGGRYNSIAYTSYYRFGLYIGLVF